VRARIACCIAVLLGLHALQSFAAVTAATDRSSLSESETLELRLRVDGASSAEQPALEPLKQDFEILSTSRNHRLSLSQAGTESFTEWVVVLMPRRAGTLQIPPIQVGAESSEALEIRVDAERSPGRTSTGDVTLEVMPDSSSVHVQEQLLVTVRLMHAVNLGQGAALTELEIPGAVVRKLDEGSHEQLIEGRRFGVFERRYAVFPQKSGELQIPSLQFQGSTGGDSWFDRFDNGARKLRLRSAASTLQVLPPEDNAAPWIPARSFSIVETWDRSPEHLRVGESATRMLTITADGLTGAQIPPLADPELPGLRFYADQPELTDAAAADGITGTRIQRVAVIPQRPGDIAFPEQRVRWWDSVHGRFEEALVPAKIIHVLPASGSATPAAPSAASPEQAQIAAGSVQPGIATPKVDVPENRPGATASRLWIVATGASLLLAAFFGVQWLRLHRHMTARSDAEASRETAAQASEKAAFAALERACNGSDAAAAANHLLTWGRARWSTKPPHSLAEIARLITEPEFAAALDSLMESRFSARRDQWDGSPLLATVRKHRPGQRERSRQDEALAPLYPDPVNTSLRP
jgi:hypothetical protein